MEGPEKASPGGGVHVSLWTRRQIEPCGLNQDHLESLASQILNPKFPQQMLKG